MKVGIIGTAGRSVPSGYVLDRKIFFWMVEQAIMAIRPRYGTDLHLVSGGAAWADHVAVHLYLARTVYSLTGRIIKSLTLHLPTSVGVDGFDEDRNALQFEKGTWTAGRSPGKTLNYYHGKFARAIGGATMDVPSAMPDAKSTVREICRAIQEGAIPIVVPESVRGWNAFRARNYAIGRGLDMLIAFTWSKGLEPMHDSGTYHCWRNSTARAKVHISLRGYARSAR